MLPSELVKLERSQQGFTLADMAAMTGFSAVYIGEIERGIKKPVSRETWGKIADALGIPIEKVRESLIEQFNSDFEA